MHHLTFLKTVKLQNLLKEDASSNDKSANGKLIYELTNLDKQTKYAIVVQGKFIIIILN